MSDKFQVPSTFLDVSPDYLKSKLKRNFDAIYRYDPRMSGGEARYYWKIKPDYANPNYTDENPIMDTRAYVSITSAISQIVVKGPAFYKWARTQGEMAPIIAAKTAEFGTVYHREVLGPLVNNGGYSIDHLKEESLENPKYLNFNMMFNRDYREDSRGWYYAFTRGAMAFWEFAKTKIVDLIAVEIPLASDKYKFAGTLDLVCVTLFRGKPRLTIIDLKSKLFYLFSAANVDKKFYDEHALQLEFQKQLLCENFPGLVRKYGGPDEILLYNYAPNNWHTKMKDDEKGERYLDGGPSWTFQNQTDSKYNKPIDMKIKGRTIKNVKLVDLKLAELQSCTFAKPIDHTVDMKGSFDTIAEFDWKEHVQVFDLVG